MVKSVCAAASCMRRSKLFSGPKMPRLDNGLITAPLDPAGDPLRPIAVGSVVTYKDFRWLRRHLALQPSLSDLTGFVRLELWPKNLLCLARTGFNGSLQTYNFSES